YVDFYGEPGPTLDFSNGGKQGYVIYKQTHMGLITLLSPLLFFAPDIHCATLYEVWSDGISKMEWNSTDNIKHLQATVLLNANIAFLAIQSIDESSVYKGCSPAQIASYVSTIMSIGSVTMGLLLLQKNCHKSRDYNRTSVSYVFYHLRLGLETLAIMYSLPWA
ncbi:uncharacterized protein EV420DRAFT_1257604, partial [Desarmillaria tabescens]